jgi:hypothetical protein
MNWLRRFLAASLLATLLASLALLAQPSPPRAQANPLCAAAGVVSGGVGVVGGAVGLGNPASDACNAVTDGVAGAVTKPVTDALKGVGNGIFEQVTTWVAEGATWLIGRVVSEIEKTTTPDLTTKGFLAEYAKMAEIAAVLAAAMFLQAILEAIAQNSWAVIFKAAFVSVPLAFIGTSIAFVVVQMLLVATDAMSHGVAVATQNHSEQFFKTAIGDLSHPGATAGGATGSVSDPSAKVVDEAAGGVAVPLFVTFLAAIIGAFAAFFVWIELVMRDAAVYVVALFMPLSLAAAISPRWSGVLRRTVELLVVIIGSKFVIVSIIALAAGLVSETGASVEHILAASALMLLSCFAPFVLMKLVLSTESAMSAAYGRRSASGGAMSGMQMASEAHMVRNMARSNWGGGAAPPEVWSVKGDGGGSSPHGGGSSGGRPGGGPRPGPSSGGGGGRGGAAKGGAAGAEAAGAGAAAAPVSAGVAAAKGARSAAEHLEQSGVTRAADQGSPPSSSSARARDAARQGRAGEGGGIDGETASPPTRTPAEKPPRPPQDISTKPNPKGAA